jgi:hypothetical protein
MQLHIRRHVLAAALHRANNKASACVEETGEELDIKASFYM